MFTLHGKTIKDVYTLAENDPIIKACLTMYEHNIGTIPMFDVLITMVCALAEQNAALIEEAET